MDGPIPQPPGRDPRRPRVATADRRRRSPPVQRKLEVGRADDPLEREADRVAAAVLRRLASPTSDGLPQVALPPAAACAQVTRIVARAPAADAAGPAGGVVDRGLETRIRAASGGAPLDDGVRQRMEAAFAADFGAVRVHANSTVAREVGATRVRLRHQCPLRARRLRRPLGRWSRAAGP